MRCVNLPCSPSLLTRQLPTPTTKLDTRDLVPLLAVGLNGASHRAIGKHRLTVMGCRIGHHIETQILIHSVEKRSGIRASIAIHDCKCEYFVLAKKR